MNFLGKGRVLIPGNCFAWTKYELIDGVAKTVLFTQVLLVQVSAAATKNYYRSIFKI
jgi:hypothetical protein